MSFALRRTRLAAVRKPAPRTLPIQRGLLRITGETLEGPRHSDAFDIVTAPGGDAGVVLLDIQSQKPHPSELAQPLLRQAARGFEERTPLHAIMLDLVRALFEFSGTQLRVTLLRCSVADARVEVTTAGMPPLACVHPGGSITLHPAVSLPLTSATIVPPPVEVMPLVWGSTWMVVSDGLTSGSDSPEVVRGLAKDFELQERGLTLSGHSPETLHDLLAARVYRAGRFAPDDATLILVGADPNARFQSGFSAG